MIIIFSGVTEQDVSEVLHMQFSLVFFLIIIALHCYQIRKLKLLIKHRIKSLRRLLIVTTIVRKVVRSRKYKRTCRIHTNGEQSTNYVNSHWFIINDRHFRALLFEGTIISCRLLEVRTAG